MKRFAWFLIFPLLAQAEMLTCICHRYERRGSELKTAIVEVYTTALQSEADGCTSVGYPWLRSPKIQSSYFDCQAVKVDTIGKDGRVQNDDEITWSYAR